MGLEAGTAGASGGSGKKAGISNKRPKLDRRLLHRLTKQVRHGKPLTSHQIHRLANVISNSDAERNLNKKDRVALDNFLRAADNHRKPGNDWAKKPGGLWSGGQTNVAVEKNKNDWNVLQTIAKGNQHKRNKGGGGNTATIGGAMDQALKNAGLRDKNAGKNRPAHGPNKGQGGGRNRGRGKGGGTSQQGMSYYGYGQYHSPSREKARALVLEENNRLKRDLLNEANQLKNDTNFDINKLDALYGRTKGDLNYVFNEANDYIGNRSKAIDDRYLQTGTSLGNIYSQLQGAMQQQSGANRDAAVGEQARLGIQQSGMGQFDADANNAQLVAQQTGANAQANNTMAQNAAAEVGNLLGSMSRASLASAVGRAGIRHQDGVTEARQGYRKGMTDINHDMREINKGRGSAIEELYNSMDDRNYQRWAEQNQIDFQNQLAVNNFNLDVSKMNSDNFWERQKVKQAAADARWKRRTKQAEFDSNRIAQNFGNMNAWDLVGGNW